MQFDVVIGNPPYKRELHMKILEHVMNGLKEDGICLWLHPARWVLDVLGKYKSSVYKKYRHLPFIKFDLLEKKIANNFFGKEFLFDLVITTLKKGSLSILNEDTAYELSNIPTKYKHLFSYNYDNIKSHTDNDINDGIRVKLKNIDNDRHDKGRYILAYDHIFIDGKKDGKDWTTFFRFNQYKKPIGSKLSNSIRFDTIKECENFIMYYKSDIIRFYSYLSKVNQHYQIGFIPFMSSYKEEWTEERLMKALNLDKEDMRYINKIMKQFK